MIWEFKKGDIVPDWVAVDEVNPDCVITFTQNVRIHEGGNRLTLKCSDECTHVMYVDKSCTGKILCGKNHEDGLFIEYTTVSYKSPLPKTNLSTMRFDDIHSQYLPVNYLSYLERS